MNVFWYTVVAVGTGFAAGAIWQAIRPKQDDDWDLLTEVDAYEFRALRANNEMLASFLEEDGYRLLALDQLAEKYAAKKHTVYKKAAREIFEILYSDNA